MLYYMFHEIQYQRVIGHEFSSLNDEGSTNDIHMFNGLVFPVIRIIFYMLVSGIKMIRYEGHSIVTINFTVILVKRVANLISP